MLEYVVDETFFDALPHGVEVEGAWMAYGVEYAEHFEGLVFGGCGEGVEVDVGLRASALGFCQDQVFHVGWIFVFALVKGRTA